MKSDINAKRFGVCSLSLQAGMEVKKDVVVIPSNEPAGIRETLFTTGKKLVICITSPISVVLIKGQLKYFSDRGFTVYLMAPSHQDVTQICHREGAVHLPVEFRREISLFHDLCCLFKVAFFLLKISPDIVNAGTPKASLLAIIAARVLHIRKRIYTCRGLRFEHESGMKRKILVVMEKLTGYFATQVICISPSISAMAVKLGVFNQKKCIVIGQGSSNGIDLSEFSRKTVNSDRVQEDRRMLGIDNRFVFGFVGRLIDRKGVRELILAFKKIRNNYPQVTLLIVGDAEMSQLSDETIIKEIRQNCDIISVGWQTDVARYLTLMDVFVLPAWWEGFGNVLIQAAALGIPVISTSATGTRDAVKDGFNGKLVNPHSVEELADAMERYLLNSELRHLHGNNGVVWARNFESNVIWAGINAVYNDK
jgi:glycosyltransferase involved in cell wall biosynthesis